MATEQTFGGAIALGFSMTNGFPAQSFLQMNAAGTWLAVAFVATESKTLNDVWAYCGATSGSPIGNDATCELYSDTSAGIPNASIDGPHASDLGGSGLTVSWLHFPSFTTALTAGTRYWLVFKNANATPATNYWYLSVTSSSYNMSQSLQTSTQGWGWTFASTTNSGSTWAGTAGQNTSGTLLGFSDSTYDGLAHQTSATVGSTNSIYSAREGGVKFTTPSNARLNIRGVAFSMGKSGTPTGNLQYRLYTGASPTGVAVATTGSLGAARLSTSGNFTGFYVLYFSSTVTVEPGTELRVVASETTQSDTSTNRYDWIEVTVKDDANARSALPFGGTLQKTYTTDASGSSVTWTDTNTLILPFAILLDSVTPFAAQATGGLLINPGLTGGLPG